MSKLDELLTIDGVVAAGEFSADGTLIAYRAKTHMFSTLAGALEQTTSMSWTPQKGWAYSGGDLTVAVGGHIGVFIKTEKADFNQLFKALIS